MNKLALEGRSDRWWRTDFGLDEFQDLAAFDSDSVCTLYIHRR
jgi:hypothetical protein